MRLKITGLDATSEHWELLFRSALGPLQRTGLRDGLAVGQVDFFDEALRLAPSQRVLDVPYGVGRHAVELACYGYAVTGVDLNAEVITAARRRCAKRGALVDLRQGEMRQFEDILPPETYSAAFCCSAAISTTP